MTCWTIPQHERCSDGNEIATATAIADGCTIVERIVRASDKNAGSSVTECNVRTEGHPLEHEVIVPEIGLIARLPDIGNLSPADGDIADGTIAGGMIANTKYKICPRWINRLN